MSRSSHRPHPHDPADPDNPSLSGPHDPAGPPPYPGPDSTYAEWQDYWNMLLSKLKEYIDNHQAGKAMVFVFTVLFLFIKNFDEDHEMAGEAKVEKALQELLRLKNRAENDFDKQRDGPDAEAAKDALICYFGGTFSDGTHTDGIKAILEKHGSEGMFDKKFIDDIKQDFEGKDGPIFHGNTKGDANSLADYWSKLWKHKGEEPSSGSVQPVVNAFQNVESDFSNQSSIVQSQLKLDEADDEQYQTIAHDGMSSFMGIMKQATSAMQSSA